MITARRTFDLTCDGKPACLTVTGATIREVLMTAKVEGWIRVRSTKPSGYSDLCAACKPVLPDRATCRVCGSSAVRVNSDGRLRSHKPPVRPREARQLSVPLSRLIWAAQGGGSARRSGRGAMKAIAVRWHTAPPVNGCRRCGHIVKGHGWRWAGNNVHRFLPPTLAQRSARLAVHLLARQEIPA